MADVNSNININFNTAAALAQLRSLQAGLSKFHQSLAEGNLAAANAQKGLNAQLIQSIGATGKFSASQVKVAGSTLAFTSALEKNKLSLREYFRYTMAAATANTRVLGKAFAAEREIINRARRDRVKALQAQYIQMNKSNAGFMDAIRVMPKTLAMANGKFTELGTRIQYAAQRQQFLNQLLKQGSTQLLNFGKNTQWAGRQLMVGLTMPLALFGGMAAKTFKELEKEIVKFRRVYGDAFTNDAETDLAVENIRRLANEYTKYGVAVTKTVEMAATAAAAGFAGSALNAQVETATKLAVLGQIEQQQALETTISLQSAFGISSEELAKKIDFLNAVENQTLLSIEDLTIAIPKAAPVVKQLGGSVEDLAFFLTAMKEGGINASEGANALKSGLASLINPSEKASKILAELGINVKSIVEGNQGDIKATVIGFADALDTLDPLNRARAIEQMFGKFQFSRLSTLFQNVTKDGTQASRALSLAGSSVEELAILSEREMKKIEDSVGVKFQAAVEQFKQDIMPLGKVFLEALTPVVKFFGNLFEKFNGLSDNTKKVIAVLVGVVAGLGPVVLMTFGLLMNLVANGIKLFSKLRGGIARLNGQTNVLGAGFNYMTQEQIENAASSQSLHQTHTRLVEVFNVEANSVNALAASYNALATQMRSMASANPALFAGGLGGAKRAVSKLPPVRKFRDGILSVPGPKGAGDIQPAMLAPGEAVIPAKTTEKYKGLISAIFKDQVPGFMAGRVPKTVAKVKGAKSEPLVIPHEERQSGAVFLGMPVSATKARQSREILDKISDGVKAGSYGSLPPTDFGTKLKNFKGFSFPERGIGGVYRKPNGEIVVVKPTIDARTAESEERMTAITREIHEGLITPKQKIRTMMDPTDPTGQRKFIVLESRYDPRIAAMDGQFSKTDMIKQLVASTLRGDRDLQRANVSGPIVADVGNAGVFDKASGFRDFAKAMPSMEQQAMINLLGVKGGAKKFFAQQTSSLAASMTPTQYANAIKAEINQAIPKLDKLIRSWNLAPDEQIVYNNMLQRLKDGAKVDWAKFQPIHARAGEGIPKYDEGLIPGVPSSVQKEQLNKYALASVEDSQSRSAELRRSAEAAFKTTLAELESRDPVRARIVKAAWEGGKAPIPPSMKEKKFPSPRQSSFLNEISKMTPVNVDGVTKYIHPVDMEAFKADPDGRAKYARTKEQVLNNLLYRMGAVPGPDGYVASGKFKGRFASKSGFITDLRSTGLQSGSWKSNVKKEFRKPLGAAEKAYNAEYANQKYIKMMTDAGLTPEQAKAELKAELSHTSKTGAPGRGPEKWLKGTGSFDSKIVNRYMNGTARLNNLLQWNKENGYSLIPKDGIDRYYQAAAFMSKGGHPTNAHQASLVALAAEADLRALADPRVPSGMRTDYTREKLIAMRSLLADKAGRGFYESATRYNFGSGNLKGLVLAKLGEYIYDKPKKTLEKITRKNSTTPGPGVKADTGKQSDSRVVTESPGRSVVTNTQAGRIARGRGVVVLPGRDAGDPTAVRQSQDQARVSSLSKAAQGRITHQMQEQAKLLKKRNNLTRAEFDKAMSLYRKKLVAAEFEKRNQAENQKRLADERKSQVQRLQSDKEIANAKKLEAKRLRQEKVGRVSGAASMALSTAGMGMMMSGNTGGGMAVMGAGAVAGMAPMLSGMGPIGWLVTGLAAMAAGVYFVNKSLEKAAKKQSEFANQTSATSDKMKKIGEITGVVGASELMDRRRSSTTFDSFSKGYDRAGQQFGTNFMSSEVGKDISKGFGVDLTLDRGTAVKKFALQLSQYVSDGVITGVQAGDIARQLSVDFKDMSLYPSIIGQLNQLIGPDGSDLLKDPMKIRVILSQEQTNVATTAAEGITTQGRTQSLGALVGLGGGNNVVGDSASAALSASLYVRALETNKANIDATNVQYEKDKEILNQKLLIAKTEAQRVKIGKELETLSDKNVDNNKTFAKETSAILLAQQKAYDKTSRGAQGLLPGQINFARNAFLTANKEQVKTRFAGTALEKDVNPFLDKTASLKSTDLEIKINAIAGTGTSPYALTTLIDMFGADEAGLDRELELGVKTRGIDKTVAMLQGLGIVEDAEVRKDLFLKINAITDEKQFADVGSTLTKIAEMEGKDFDINTYLKGNAFAKLKELSELIRKVQDIPDPIEKTTIVDMIERSTNPDEKSALSAVIANWEWLLSLPKDIRKTATTTLITAFDMVGQDQIDAEIAKRVAAAGAGGGYAAQYYRSPEGQDFIQSYLAGQAAKPQYTPEELKKIKDGLNNKNNNNAGENPLAFLDSLAMGLKQVRDNAFNALTPIESLLAAFTNKKTQKDAFSLFDGIQNRLLRMGVGEDLRGAIESMTAKDFDKIAKLEGKKALFTFAKGKPKSKATITGLTESGKAVDQGYKEKALGNFNFANEETIKNVQDQTKAYNMLISSGLTASQALEVVSSQGQAAAIAAEAIKKGTPEWDYYIEKIKGANTELERQSVLNKILRENEDFKMYKEMPKLASQMKDLGYGTDQIDKVLGDPQLAKILMDDLKDGKLDAADIAENLDNIEAKKLIDIQVQLNKGDFAEAADLGRQIVDEMFAAYEGLIRTGDEANKIIANDKLISGYEADLEPFTKDIQKLTEDVDDLNRSLEMNPLFGDRAIQAIEDENSVLSNDLTIIANAAEEVNKKYDEQAEALSKVQEINAEILDQQKRQLDLADAITSGDISAAARAVQEMRAASAAKFASAQSEALQRARETELAGLTARPGGLTQEQITKKQYENSQRIYAMEKDPRRIAILKQIQGKQDEIYNIEENDVEVIQAKIDARAQDNRELQRSIDKQLAAITVYGKTRQAWDTVNAGIDYHAAAMLTLNNPDALAGLVTAAGKVDEVWTNINKQMDEYKKGMPDSVKTSLGLIKTGETQTDIDKARLAKEREDKEEADRKLAVLALAVRKQGAGIPLSNEEKELLAASQPKNRRRVSNGAFQTLASGGKVRGPGTSTSDSIPAMLSNGEYVINADSVNKYGVETFDSLNAQRLHKGGPVGHRHGRNAPVMPQLVPGTGVYNGSMFIPPQYSTTSVGTPAPSEKNNSWLARYARSLEERDKRTQAMLDKSPLTSWMGADVLGLTGLLKTITGQGTATDKFNGALFPLNFLGVGKLFGEGSKAATPVVKQTSGILSKITKPFKAAGSKIAAPFKELFLPAANPMFNMKNSFIKGFQTGQSRMGFITDTKLIKKTEAITKPLIAKLDEAGFERIGTGSDNWFRKGTGNQAPRPGNQIEPGDPLWDTVLAISKAEVAGMNTQRQAKNVGYYASVAGAFVRKVKDKVVDTVPGLKTLVDSRLKLPGQISEKALKIGEMLPKTEAGINSTFRAILDGVPGFYKTGIDFAEVKREMFGSLFARASKLIAPENIPVVGSGHLLANGIFSPDVAAQGAVTLKSLATLDPLTGVRETFDKTADVGLAASSGYRSAIMAAMRFVDSHDGNLTVNPETLVPGLIDFGRVLDWSPFTPTVDGLASEMAAPLFGVGTNHWRDPEITSAFFSGIDKGVEFLSTMKAADIAKMLKAAGYKGEELKKKTDLILASIKTTIEAVPRVVDDITIKQDSWFKARSDMPPIPGAPKPSAAGAPRLTPPALSTPTNPLKTAALSTLTGAAAMAGILIADPDMSSLKITQAPQVRRGGNGRNQLLALSQGGLVPNYFAAGGYAIGTDTVPAMLTPGEFVMSKYAVDKYGIDNMKSINSGSSVGDSVYNYNLNLNVKSDANPDEIARAVMVQIKSVDAQRIRGARI